jgi:N-methylhydantoinase A
MLASDVEHHFVRAAGGVLSAAGVDRWNGRLDEMAAEARATLASEGYTGEEARLECHADLRYVGQASELTIAIPGGRFTPSRLPELSEAFGREYAATYGYASDEPIEVVNLRTVAAGVRPGRLDFRAVRVAAADGSTGRGTRPVSFGRGAPALDTPIWPREDVPADAVAGPLIVESYDSTVVIPPGAAVRRDPFGNLVVALG